MKYLFVLLIAVICWPQYDKKESQIKFVNHWDCDCKENHSYNTSGDIVKTVERSDGSVIRVIPSGIFNVKCACCGKDSTLYFEGQAWEIKPPDKNLQTL